MLSARPQSQFRRISTIIAVVCCVACDVVALIAVIFAFALDSDGTQAEYACGEVFKIRAAAAIGWLFAGLGALLRLWPGMYRRLRWGWFYLPMLLLAAASYRFLLVGWCFE